MQALCFLAGANSLFTGDKLLTTKNPAFEDDRRLLGKLGMEAEAPGIVFEQPEGRGAAGGCEAGACSFEPR
jgi:biotin synthase